MALIAKKDNIDNDKKWFAIYVRSRYEKKVLKLLEDKGVESFLPLITRVKQWSDRKKKVIEPLFRSYLFVHIRSKNSNDKEYNDIRFCDGVVRFVSSEGNPIVVPENQIIAIKKYLEDTDIHDIENYEDITEGEFVRIKSGQMKGLIGRFTEIKGKHRLIIEIETIGKTIPINVSRSMIEPFRNSNI